MYQQTTQLPTIQRSSTTSVQPAGVPVVAGEEGICKGCGVATLSISYYDLGVATGKMAAKVLQGEDISTMPIEYAPTVYKRIRCNAAAKHMVLQYLMIM